jgi:hypothetical protein
MRTCGFSQIFNDAKIDSMGPREEIIILKVASEKKFPGKKAEYLHGQG